jgi:hypothetical protein
MLARDLQDQVSKSNRGIGDEILVWCLQPFRYQNIPVVGHKIASTASMGAGSAGLCAGTFDLVLAASLASVGYPLFTTRNVPFSLHWGAGNKRGREYGSVSLCAWQDNTGSEED